MKYSKINNFNKVTLGAVIWDLFSQGIKSQVKRLPGIKLQVFPTHSEHTSNTDSMAADYMIV